MFPLQQSFDKVAGRLLTATYSIDDRPSRVRYDDGGVSDFSMNYLGNREQMAAIDYYSPVGKNQSYYITAKYTHRDYGSRDESGIYTTMTNGGVVTGSENMDYTQQVGSALNMSVDVSNPWRKYRNWKQEIESPQLHTLTTMRRYSGRVWVRISYDFGKFREHVKSARRSARNIDRDRM